jgi:hypothetical protein
MARSYESPKILFSEFLGNGCNGHRLFWMSLREPLESGDRNCLAEKEHFGRIVYCTRLGDESCRNAKSFCDYRDGEMAPEDLKAKRLEQIREIAYMQIGE